KWLAPIVMILLLVLGINGLLPLLNQQTPTQTVNFTPTIKPTDDTAQVVLVVDTPEAMATLQPTATSSSTSEPSATSQPTAIPTQTPDYDAHTRTAATATAFSVATMTGVADAATAAKVQLIHNSTATADAWTETPTLTLIPTNTSTRTFTLTNTSSPTNMPTYTFTAMATNTPTLTWTWTPTPSATRTPLPTNTPTSTWTSSPTQIIAQSQPCSIRTERVDIPIYVWPGENRSVRGALSPNQDILVTGQFSAEDGSLWWKILPEGTTTELDRYWVKQSQVTQFGDCSTVGIAISSLIISMGQISVYSNETQASDETVPAGVFQAQVLGIQELSLNSAMIALQLYVPSSAQQFTNPLAPQFKIRTTFYASSISVSVYVHELDYSNVVFDGTSYFRAFLSRRSPYNDSCAAGTQITSIQVELRNTENTQTYYAATVPMNITC
ncbi:MAG: hypothetical protein ABI835_01850, partial [Chloroflexota bacterium]